MFRFIFVLAALYCIFWCCNNIDFNNFKTSAIEIFKKEKTVSIVDKTRAELNQQIEEAME